MKSIKSFPVCLMSFLLLMVSWPVYPDTSHEEIIRRADEARGNITGIEWRIDLTSIENGEAQNRKFKIIAKGYNCVATYLSPANVKGRKLLMVDRNMWFYKPGLRKPVPISPKQKLMGEASNGDIASTNYARDYEIISVEDVTYNNKACFLYYLKARSKSVTYDQIRYWISKDQQVGLRSEYYTISGKLFKTAAFEYKNSVVTNHGKQPFISKMVITNQFINKNATEIVYQNVKLMNVPDSTFNINLLTR